MVEHGIKSGGKRELLIYDGQRFFPSQVSIRHDGSVIPSQRLPLQPARTIGSSYSREIVFRGISKCGNAVTNFVRGCFFNAAYEDALALFSLGGLAAAVAASAG